MQSENSSRSSSGGYKYEEGEDDDQVTYRPRHVKPVWDLLCMNIATVCSSPSRIDTQEFKVLSQSLTFDQVQSIRRPFCFKPRVSFCPNHHSFSISFHILSKTNFKLHSTCIFRDVRRECTLFREPEKFLAVDSVSSGSSRRKSSARHSVFSLAMCLWNDDP